MGTVDKAFLKAGQGPGLQIWRIEVRHLFIFYRYYKKYFFFKVFVNIFIKCQKCIVVFVCFILNVKLYTLSLCGLKHFSKHETGHENIVNVHFLEYENYVISLDVRRPSIIYYMYVHEYESVMSDST